MENSDTKPTEERTLELEENLKSIQKQIESSIGNRLPTLPNIPITLIAVSKTKPASDIQGLYNLGHRDFGENYVKELIEKASLLPKDINWHFIGNLQSNKVNKIVIPELKCIQTIDSVKLAGKVDANVREKNIEKLDVFVQVNTDDKKEAGIDGEDDIFALVDFILNKCQNLNFRGLMTIGAYGDDQKMIELRKEISEKLELDLEKIELSMGMSADFEEAIQEGATCVRVGSSIFGSRNYN